MTSLEILRWATAVSGAVAASLAFMAARVHVRDDLDNFISDVHRQSWWAIRAAVASSITALLLVGQTFIGGYVCKLVGFSPWSNTRKGGGRDLA